MQSVGITTKSLTLTHYWYLVIQCDMNGLRYLSVRAVRSSHVVSKLEIGQWECQNQQIALT